MLPFFGIIDPSDLTLGSTLGMISPWMENGTAMEYTTRVKKERPMEATTVLNKVVSPAHNKCTLLPFLDFRLINRMDLL